MSDFEFINEPEPQKSPAPQPQYPPSQYPQLPYAQPPFVTAPVFPAATMPPEQPKGRRRAWVTSLVAVRVVVLLGAAFASIVVLRHSTGLGRTQAETILNQAANSGLHDTTFTLAVNESVDTGSGNTFSLTLNGDGAIIVKPLAMHMTLSSNVSSGLAATTPSISEEVILLGTEMYIKLGGLSATDITGKPWIKIALADLSGMSTGSLGGGLGSTNFLDYRALHNPVLIGSEQISGHATWHLRATMSATDDSVSPDAQATATARYKQAGITQSDITEDMWILQDSSFPAKIVTHMSLASHPPTSSTTANSSTPSTATNITIDETYSFTTWNTGVTITPPPASQVTTQSSLLAPTPPAQS